MKTLVTRTLLVLAMVVTISAELSLYAQETNQQQQPADQEPPTVTEEIVVTARKQEETIQEVPFSVAAPSGEELRDLGAEDIEDVAANVAGFTVQNLGPGQSQVAMRGVSSGQIVRDQPGVKEQVGVYLDESVISLSLFTPDVDLFDLSRVEILRGPQGTLFGSGSLSGTVRYITNQPRLGATESIGELMLNTISDGGVGGSAKYAGNFPIGDTSAMRVVAYYTSYGGFTDAVDAVTPAAFIDEDVNTGDRIGGRLSFLFQPNTRLRITPRLLYQSIDMEGWNRIDVYNILGNPFTTSRARVNLSEDERLVVAQMEEPFTDDFLLGDVTVAYDFGGAELTSITSYTDRDVLVVRDAGALTASITGGSFAAPAVVYTLDAPLFDATQAQGFTQELRLSGNARNRFEWVAGVFYSDTTRDYGQNLPVIGFEALCRTNPCGPLTNVPTAGTKLAETDELFKSDLHYDNSQLALFGEVSFEITDRFEILGGLRWYDFEEDRVQVFDGVFADPIDSVGSVAADGIAPRVMLSYELSDATRLNAQISKGFRLGGINDPLNVPLCTPGDLAIFSGFGTWEDEELWNYEIGSKSRIMGGRGTLNLAAFQMDIENLQATVTAGSCSSRLIFNVPEAQSTGLEAELELAPTDNFDFAVSASFTNSELQSTFMVNNTVVAGIEEGNRLPTVPEFQMAAAATYRWPMAQGRLGYLTGVYQHVGSRFTQIGDQAEGFGTVDLTSFGGDIGGPYTQNIFRFDPELPAYDIINARVGLLINNWDVALFVNNLTDEIAFLALDQERGTRARVGYLTNQPRTIGISTRFNF